MITNLSPQAQAIVDAFNGYHEMVNRRVKIAAALRALVEKLGYDHYYHIDDGEGGILYDCKNYIIDVCEVTAIINQLEAL
jgi:hypothetical protein